LRANSAAIVAANEQDLAGLSDDRTAAFRDRLTLTPERVKAMARGLEDVAKLPDPLGRILAEWKRPNGLLFRRVAVPLGVIGMIYESRPNVGADAAALCIKSGNAVILRGGGESLHSARAIHAAMVTGLEQAALDPACVQILPSADRALVGALLQAADGVDLIIPRGGKSLVERVQREARVPVLAHADGLNHTYVHASADPEMARRVLLDAKMRRTGICGATETLLIDRAIAPSLLPLIVNDLAAKGCTFRADEAARAIIPALPAASAADFDTEWLDSILSIAVIDGVEEALDHIARHG
ncbi:glutamate-5-semialdehyde dehydrogenase, partial [Gluconobacter cerinus]|uniref:glutamate-5-semialdehyde dehydrogenase n=2 Tax=Gluconobacter TaxID=441 RepID=UPI001C044C85